MADTTPLMEAAADRAREIVAITKAFSDHWFSRPARKTPESLIQLGSRAGKFARVMECMVNKKYGPAPIVERHLRDDLKFMRATTPKALRAPNKNQATKDEVGSLREHRRDAMSKLDEIGGLLDPIFPSQQ